MEGSSTRRCIGGSWDGEDPICVGLSQHHDYSTKKPPTILFRHEKGAIAQSNHGELVIVPGTTLHMECLFRRKYGTPTWYINNYSGRTYPQVLCIFQFGRWSLIAFLWLLFSASASASASRVQRQLCHIITPSGGLCVDNPIVYPLETGAATARGGWERKRLYFHFIWKKRCFAFHLTAYEK